MGDVLPPTVTHQPPLNNNLSTSVSKSKLYYDRRSVGQSVLVSGTHLGPGTNFSPSFFNYFFNGFVDVGRPFWWEVGSIVFSCYWASPALSFSSLSSMGLMNIFYCLNFLNSPTWMAGSCIYFPQEQGSPVVPLGILGLTSQQSQSYITTDSQSASPSWCQAPIWDPWLIFLSPWNFL
jgi:hypothetical protein